MSQRSFEQLQEGLAQWSSSPSTSEAGGTIVAVPSLSLPYFGTPAGQDLVHYEERIFYLVHFLQNPRNKLIIITSKAVAETLVSYLLHLLPGVPHSHARRRLTLFSVQDHSDKPLTQKILDRPHLMARIRSLIAGEPRTTLSCYTVTELEQKLAEQLQIPVYGPRPEHLKLATKSVARNIFSDLGLTVADGAEHLSSMSDIAEALVELAESKPGLEKAVLKHDYSLAGLGNAVIDLEPLRQRLSGERPADFLDQVAGELPRWVALDPERDAASYWQRFGEGGGVLEEFVDGDTCSAQVRVGGDGSVEVIATHDEVTGGADGHTYSGSRMPAHPRVAGPLAEAGLKVGRRLAELGVVGRFDVDFLACPAGSARLDRLVALDINLRKGHTTLPIRTLQLLSQGQYDAQAGIFRSGVRQGQPMYYLSSDHFGAGKLVGLLPRDLLEIISSAGLHYSSATHTGALFHMLGSMSERGKVGVTSIAHSHEEADEVYQTVAKALQAQRDGYEWIT